MISLISLNATMSRRRPKIKGIFSIAVLAFSLLTLLAACGGKAATPEQTDPVPSATFVPTPPTMVMQFGTPDSDFASGVAIDGAGNVYVIGTIQQGALPGQASLGDADAYLRKYDSRGKEVWTQQFGTQSEDHGNGVTVDGADNLYVVGMTRGPIAGQTGLVGIDYDAYVRKFDSDGSVLWTRQFGTPRQPGIQGDDRASDVAVDVAGNVYVVGFTFGSLPWLSPRPGQFGRGWRLPAQV